jgi:hypothetical protein
VIQINLFYACVILCAWIFLFSDCIIIPYNHNHITKLVTFSRPGGGGSSCPCLFDFKILFSIIIIISDEIFQLSHVIFIIQFLSTKYKIFSQIHVRLAYLFLRIRPWGASTKRDLSVEIWQMVVGDKKFSVVSYVLVGVILLQKIFIFFQP